MILGYLTFEQNWAQHLLVQWLLVDDFMPSINRLDTFLWLYFAKWQFSLFLFQNDFWQNGIRPNVEDPKLFWWSWRRGKPWANPFLQNLKKNLNNRPFSAFLVQVFFLQNLVSKMNWAASLFARTCEDQFTVFFELLLSILPEL